VYRENLKYEQENIRKYGRAILNDFKKREVPHWNATTGPKLSTETGYGDNPVREKVHSERHLACYDVVKEL
jgi:hypothetical protein